ncbi:MAG: SDR family NAD(P)-dependent oxidoreductase [Archangium sp.]|nr:SDR family NAD(P)-dependent oxidoreductase [Archangium sp.]
MTTFGPYAGSWAIVTGACSGIGRAYADRLAAAGLKVVMISESAERLAAAAEEIRRVRGAEIETRCIDLSQLEFEGEIEALLGSRDVTVLVSNAAFGGGGAFWSQDRARLRTMVDLNVGAYLLLTHLCTKAFVEARRGVVILVSSLNVASPVPTAAVYTATKAFEYYLGAALWDEVRGTGVVVQVVLPGPTRTNFQAVAGTKVARVALEPEVLVDLAMRRLGDGPVFVPLWHNRVMFRWSGLFSLGTRIRVAGQLYLKLLRETPDVSPVRLTWRALFQRRLP